MLRLLPAHPPALCSLAALLQADAVALADGAAGVLRWGGERQGGQGGQVDVGKEVGQTTGDVRVTEREKLVFMAEELLLTAAEVVECVKSETSSNVGADGPGVPPALRAEQTGGRGRWRRHKADVWSAYGGFLSGIKGDVAGAARAFVEALKSEPHHPTALAQYAELASNQMHKPRIAEYLYRQLLAGKQHQAVVSGAWCVVFGACWGLASGELDGGSEGVEKRKKGRGR